MSGENMSGEVNVAFEFLKVIIERELNESGISKDDLESKEYVKTKNFEIFRDGDGSYLIYLGGLTMDDFPLCEYFIHLRRDEMLSLVK